MIRFFFAALLLFSSCVFHESTSRKLLDKYYNTQFDAIIVPGVPFEDGTWSRIMKGRVYWAKYLYDKGIAKNIIFSGGAVYSPYAEAEIMSMYAEKLGIDPANIFTETLAEHSTENVYYSYRKARKLGFSSVALASGPFQTRMLKKFIRKKMNNVVSLLPFVIDTLEAIQPEMTDPVIEYSKAFVPGFRNIKERENFRERLMGTLGLRIDTSAYN